MRQTIGIYEAKTHLSRLIDRAAAGDCIIITRNGVEVAELRPIHPARETSGRLLERFKAFRQRQGPGAGTLRRDRETLRELAHERHDR